MAAAGMAEAALESLVGQEGSCVAKVVRAVHLALSPATLGDLRTGVTEYFAPHINRYYPALQGILLGYARPRLTTNTAAVLHDQPYIHLDVRAEFYVFSPTKGEVLAGLVNRRSADHLGCLVHGIFNVALAADRREVLQEGEEVSIQVTALSYNRDSLPLIQGKLVRGVKREVEGYDSGIEVKLEAVSPGKRKREEKMDVEEEEGKEEDSSAEKRARLDVELNDVGDAAVKKSKKKKKHKDKSAEEPLAEIKIKQEVLSSEALEKPAKPKKKKRDKL